VADIAIGLLLWWFAGGLSGDEGLVWALEIVGLGLAVAGLVGYLMFAALARGAGTRT
jgi:hypothetical protein